MNTLQEALWAAPVGHLQLKMCNVHHVSDGFGFLGYHVFRNVGGRATARPRQAAFEGLNERLGLVASAPIEEKVNNLISWRCAYAAWEGGDSAEDVLVALLSNHFSGDLEELVRLIHLRAKITRMNGLRA